MMCDTRPYNWENLRANYRPDIIRVLFIGESPPASGMFFYRENSTLYYATKEAFNNPSNFLIKFQNWGFFLDDLVRFPINRFDDVKRKAERLGHQDELAARLINYQPLAVVTVMKGIKSHVDKAIELAGLAVKNYALPFPWSKQYRIQYVNGLRKLLPEFEKLHT